MLFVRYIGYRYRYLRSDPFDFSILRFANTYFSERPLRYLGTYCKYIGGRSVFFVLRVFFLKSDRDEDDEEEEEKEKEDIFSIFVFSRFCIHAFMHSCILDERESERERECQRHAI